jgi:hypothetical protein
MKWALVANHTHIETVSFWDEATDEDAWQWAKDNRCVWWQWGTELGGSHVDAPVHPADVERVLRGGRVVGES